MMAAADQLHAQKSGIRPDDKPLDDKSFIGVDEVLGMAYSKLLSALGCKSAACQLAMSVPVMAEDPGAAEGELGIEAANGSRVTGFTRHGINRAIGDAGKRAGTKPQAILDALRNPTKPVVRGVDAKGRPFEIFSGKDARVVINPENGNIVSVNPLSGSGAN